MISKLASLREASERSPFRRNFRRVLQANVLSQIILIASTPILTRLYTPEAFGQLALFTAILWILASFSTWRYEWLMPNAASLQVAAVLFIAGTLTLFFFCIVSFGMNTVVSNLTGFTILEQYQLLGALTLILPFALAGLGSNQLLQGWFIRVGDLAPTSRARILQSISFTVIAISLGYLVDGAFGLIAATTISIWFGIVFMITRADVLRLATRKLTRLRLLTVAKHKFRQASICSMVSLLNTTSATIAVLLLTSVYSMTEIGWYTLMTRLVSAPIGVVTAALATSFWARSAELAREKHYQQLRQLYFRITRLLSGAALLVCLGATAGSFVVRPVLGNEWAGSEVVLLALLPLIIGDTVFSPGNHLVVLGKQSWQLLADSLRIILIALSVLAASYYQWPFPMAVLAVSTSSLLGHLTLFFTHTLAYRQLGKHPGNSTIDPTR